MQERRNIMGGECLPSRYRHCRSHLGHFSSSSKNVPKNCEEGAFLQQFPSDFSSDESVVSLYGEECNFSFFQMIGKPHLYQNFEHKVDRYDQPVPVT